jgi:CRP-like cAMP-binding protein
MLERFVTPKLHSILKATAPRDLSVPRGEFLFREGQAFEHCYVIKSGYVKVYSSNGSGTNIFLTVSGPGALLGAFALFHKGMYPVTVKTATDTRLSAMPGGACRQLFEKSLPFR